MCFATCLLTSDSWKLCVVLLSVVLCFTELAFCGCVLVRFVAK